MAALPNLVTVAEFRRIADDGGAYELHYGEVCPVTRPKAKHYEPQRRLVQLLETRLSRFGQVGMEFPYRPVAEFDLRVADVAAVSQSRYNSIDPDDNLRGAPDLVIEIKSPSNTDRKLRELASLTLANGAIECWIIDADQATVTVVRRDGATSVFLRSQNITLAAFAADVLSVDEILAPNVQDPNQTFK